MHPRGVGADGGTVTVWREAEAGVREPGEGDDELTTAVDQLDLLSMLEAAGIAGDRAGFDSCGPCETWLRAGSDAEKSITVHDCDVHGGRVRSGPPPSRTCRRAGTRDSTRTADSPAANAER